MRWVRDYAESKADGHITLDVAEAALKMVGVDGYGLAPMDRRYLQTLLKVFNGGPAGIEAIGYTMNVSSDTLEDEVEPYLLREGWVTRSPRGRMVTEKTYQLFPDDSADGRLF